MDKAAQKKVARKTGDGAEAGPASAAGAASAAGSASASAADAAESADSPATAPPARSTPKSEQTRALILETAMRLFGEHGYDKTTMRAIAAEAGLSVGSAYYYFESKEYLIQGFYDRSVHDHAATARARISGSTDFAERLETTLTAWLDCSAPYHEFAAQFFRTAADPDSPMSPFSDESHPARAITVDLLGEVLNGSDLGPKLDAELAELLPDLLWLHLMAVVLYWVFDRTEGTERTRAFVRRSTPLLAKVINLSRYRMFRPLLRDAKDLIHDFVLPVVGRTQERAGARADAQPTVEPNAEPNTEPQTEPAKDKKTSRKSR